MFDHVLVPLDGSPLAEQSLDYAVQVVKPGGMVTLVSVVPPPDVSMYAYAGFSVPYGMIEAEADYVAQEKAMVADARNYLARIADNLEKGALYVNTLVMTGDPADIIVAEARQLEVDAIVISTHGRSGLNRWLFGSVTMRVLGAATCPVLVIPSKNLQHEVKAQAGETEYVDVSE